MSRLQPIKIGPFNRGCVETVVFENLDVDGNWIPFTGKRVWLTAKTEPFDYKTNDVSKVFKVEGVISADEPGRVTFSLSEKNTWQDPEIPYFFDIVTTNNNGTGAERIALGQFWIIGGANNAQAGGDENYD